MRAVQRYFKRSRLYLLGQRQKTHHLQIFLPVCLTLVVQRLVTGPAHYRAKSTAMRVFGTPFREENRLPCGEPAMTGCRNRRGKPFAKGEMDVMRIHSPTKFVGAM